MKPLLYLPVLFFLVIGPAFSQDFNYVRYNTRQGLAGSNVVEICQDNDGFIWFATENGVSRFDGRDFVNFTVKDGLPDNEVLALLPDQKGRIWIGTFTNAMCFYYQGKLYNTSNSPLLKQLKLVSHVKSIMKDALGNVYLSDKTNLYKLNPDDRWEELSQLPDFRKHRYAELNLDFIDNFQRLHFGLNDSLFRLNGSRLEFVEIIRHKPSKAYTYCFGLSGSSKIVLPATNILLRETYKNHRLRFLATTRGAWAVDTVNCRLDSRFLEDQVVNYVFEDSEKNLWFGTEGNGIFKLPSQEAKTIRMDRNAESRTNEVFSLMRHRETIYAGLGFSRAAMIRNNRLEDIRDLSTQTEKAENNVATNRLYYSLSLDDDLAFLGFDAFLIKLSGGKMTSSPIKAIKCMDKLDDSHILLGNYAGAYKVRISDLAITDTIFRKRITRCKYHQQAYMLGTTSGLYRVGPDKKQEYLGQLIPALSRRISGFANTTDGILWISTGDAGVVGIDNGKVVATFNQTNGLSSDICKSIYASGNDIWVGTNAGLNKIIRKGNRQADILKFGVLDGLPSDNVNTILVDGQDIYVGSPEGLTFFNEQKLISQSICRLKLLDVEIDGKKAIWLPEYKLGHRENNIGFKYAGISMRSAGDIRYNYRLLGLDDKWITTTQAQVVFPALPPGDYEFQVNAVNKFGVISNTDSVKFSIAAPFWTTWWFYVLLALSLISMTAMVVSAINKAENRRLTEKNETQKKIASLEQQALQAQMNPHFIFNCLNSIQQYFLSKDSEKANRLLTTFASLVRETLHYSAIQTITVSAEMHYLTRYLEMEKMRFGDTFDYAITTSPNLDADEIKMPALLLQPYVENAVRHGIRHMSNGIGSISVHFNGSEDVLECRITDNGIGRKAAAYYKGKQHIEYQSKGMELGFKRLEILKGLHPHLPFSAEVLDLQDDSGNPAGTQVIISLAIIDYE